MNLVYEYDETEHSIEALRSYVLEHYVGNPVRNFYDEIGQSLSDRALCTIVYHEAPEDEMLDIFEAFAELTDDPAFALELRERCDFIANKHDAVCCDEDGFLFKLETIDNEREETRVNGIYKRFSDAEKIGIRSRMDFKITKLRLIGFYMEALEMMEVENEVDHEYGDILYKMYPSGPRIWASSSVYEYENEINEIGRFEAEYYGILHPFRLGDYVKTKDGKIGIISDIRDEFEMRAAIERKRNVGTFSNEAIRVDFLYDKLKFGWNNYPVYELEYASQGDILEAENNGYRWLMDAITGPVRKPEDIQTVRFT